MTSNNEESIAMWAHYANNHQGFCVSYDKECNKELFCKTFPIQYINERIDVTNIMVKFIIKTTEKIKEQIAKRQKEILINDLSVGYMPMLLCNLKHSSWEKEQELRCTLTSESIGIPYITAKPREIFIGMKCSPKHSKILCEIAHELNIPIRKIITDESSSDYKLTAI